jgi:hypothetical protein
VQWRQGEDGNEEAAAATVGSRWSSTAVSAEPRRDPIARAVGWWAAGSGGAREEVEDGEQKIRY